MSEAATAGLSAGSGSGSAVPLLLPPLSTGTTAILVVGMAGSGKSTFAARLAEEVNKRDAALAAQAAQAKAQVEGKGKAPEPSGVEGAQAQGQGQGAYFVNLDPAVHALAYPPNVDIRDTIDYAQVMRQYGLGPNGGILTALNLFTTKFDQVLGILERRAVGAQPQTQTLTQQGAKDEGAASGEAKEAEREAGAEQEQGVSTIILDTPGQIEIFTWSASGSLITSSLLSSSIPTLIAYIVDTPRTTSPATFMSNMLYACSILYKCKLPFVLVFNKTDVQDWGYAREWMDDFESFQRALKRNGGNPTRSAVPLSSSTSNSRTSAAGKKKDGQGEVEGEEKEEEEMRASVVTGEEEGNFMGSLMNSMALVLDEFYSGINVSPSVSNSAPSSSFLRCRERMCVRRRLTHTHALHSSRYPTSNIPLLLRRKHNHIPSRRPSASPPRRAPASARFSRRWRARAPSSSTRCARRWSARRPSAARAARRSRSRACSASCAISSSRRTAAGARARVLALALVVRRGRRARDGVRGQRRRKRRRRSKRRIGKRSTRAMGRSSIP